MSEPKYLTIASLSRALLADRRAVEKLDPKADATVVDGGKEVKLFLQNRVEELAKSLVEEAGKSKKRK
jgi:hypothetical protein